MNKQRQWQKSVNHICVAQCWKLSQCILSIINYNKHNNILVSIFIFKFSQNIFHPIFRD